MISLSSFALVLCASLASAARLSVSIPGTSPLLPNPANLPPSTHAVLVGPPGVRYDVPIRRDSTFVFPDLAAASYLLTLHSRDYFFPPLRVDITKATDESQPELMQAWQTFRGNEWDNKGPHYGSGKGELQVTIQPSSRKDFYQDRGGFNIIGFLKSPMILMALVSAAMIFGMPYLMDNSMLATKLCASGYRTMADIVQWTQKRKQSLRKCQRRARLWDLKVQPARCRTSTLRVGWRARVQAQIVDRLVVVVRSDELGKNQLSICE